MDKHEVSIFGKYYFWNEHQKGQRSYKKKDVESYAMCYSCGGGGCASCG